MNNIQYNIYLFTGLIETFIMRQFLCQDEQISMNDERGDCDNIQCLTYGR